MLKLSKAARERNADKFTFCESDGKTGGDSRAVCALHVRLEALSQARTFHDMVNRFQMLPSDTSVLIESRLEKCSNAQSLLDDSGDALATDP